MSARVIGCAKFVLGLLLAPLFAVSLTLAIGTTVVLVKDVIAAGGDRGAFEAQMRHYGDRFESAPDGSLISHRAPHPVRSFFALVALGWIGSLVFGYLLAWLGRHVSSSGSGGR